MRGSPVVDISVILVLALYALFFYILCNLSEYVKYFGLRLINKMCEMLV